MIWPNTNLKYIFGLKLRHFRQEQSLSLKELAERTGLSVSYINEIEKGKKYPKAERIMQLAEGLGVSYDELVSLDLSHGLNHMNELFNSSILNSFPYQLFGITLENVLDLLISSPKKATALVSTLHEIVRSYDMDEERFFLASLRAYQEMHSNYFEDLEGEVERFLQEVQWNPFPAPEYEEVVRLLGERYRLEVILTDFSEYPEMKSQRYLYLPGKPPRMLINRNLSGMQHRFALAVQLGYFVLKLPDQARTSSWLRVGSFDEVLNHFRASYFAGALLINRFHLEADLSSFSKRVQWDGEALLRMIQRYQASPETFLHRLSQILPGLFDLKELHFLRFEHELGQDHFQLSKELNMPRTLVPAGAAFNEHHCRRWLPITVLRDLQEHSGSPASPDTWRIGAQRARFVDSGKEVFFISIARPLRLLPNVNRSMTLGIHMDDRFREKVRFWNDPNIPQVEVNETCERCPLTEAQCAVRAVPPLVYRREQLNRQRQETFRRLTEANRQGRLKLP
ncbi:MAG: helix-turn-helix domain-containing protein [bacterium]|jgi:transcriptional regulator with XRE-family HTH domain